MFQEMGFQEIIRALSPSVYPESGTTSIALFGGYRVDSGESVARARARSCPSVKAARFCKVDGTGDVRFEDVADPKITKPTDAVIGLAATCVCGSDLWSYRGISPVEQPTPMGHEYCGVVEEVGSEVKSVKPGQFVIGSFFASDNTCPHCNFGYQTSCQQKEFVGGAQAPVLRVPLADGTLVPTPGMPSEEMIPNLLATSDVLGTGWFAADAATVKPGMTFTLLSPDVRRARIARRVGSARAENVSLRRSDMYFVNRLISL
jgi:hypothetical protein